MCTETLRASSAHAVNKASNVYLGNIAPFGASQQQSMAPTVDDHIHGVLVNSTDDLWDSYSVTSPAISSSEYHVA